MPIWPFTTPKIAPDDLRRLDRVEERVESFERRLAAVLEDVDEYFRKVNKARQRVVKQEADEERVQGRRAAAEPEELTRDQQKANLRARILRR